MKPDQLDSAIRPQLPAMPHEAVGRTWVISAVLAVAALLPVALLSYFAYSLAASRMRELVASNNASAAQITGELIRSDLARVTDMAKALAAQPGMVAAIEKQDADAVRQRLRATFEALNRAPAGAATQPVTGPVRRMDRAYVTDPAGLQWSDFPHAPESIGKNFSDRDWYRGVVASGWQPYMSAVYQRNAKPQIQIVAMAAPVRRADGEVIGVIVFQLPLAYLSDVLKAIHVGNSGYVYIVDGRGSVAAHPKLTDLATTLHRETADNAEVKRTLAGERFAAAYRDPISQEEMIAAFQPIAVPNATWATVAQQPRADVIGPIRRMGLSIAAAGSIIATAMIALVAVLRHAALRDRRLRVELDTRRQALERLAGELSDTADAEHAARVEAQAAHASLRLAQSRLVQTEKLAGLGQLVAGVAHEINNPLAFVLNNVAVLQRDVKAVESLLELYRSGDEAIETLKPEVMKEIRELADDIDLAYTMTEMVEIPTRSREGLVRIQQIVKDLRDFARQNVLGDVQPDADINAGIESTLNIARGTAKKHQVELVSDLAPLPGVTCSPGKINQVILNLVSNAIHASPPNEKVIVRTRQESPGIVIEVVDHGTGIDPAIRDRIFDPFFTTKPQGVGTGLGLSISHGIVSDHGGSIEVDSTVGAGTTFRVRLPLSQAKPAAAAAPEQSTAAV